MTVNNAPDALADRPADATVSAPTLLGRGFRDLQRYSVVLRGPDSSETSCTRDVLRLGAVVGVLPVDLARNELVLIRQFRLAAHLALGRGDLVEIVAGHVEDGEAPADAAIRECEEEIGVRPQAVHELFRFMPAPGLSDEHAVMFLGLVDAAQAAARAGAVAELEDTHPFRVDIDAALAGLARNRMCNGYLILALQWLALHRDRLAEILAEPRDRT
jgi:ADP-ribose pyrophosphatase